MSKRGVYTPTRMVRRVSWIRLVIAVVAFLAVAGLVLIVLGGMS